MGFEVCTEASNSLPAIPSHAAVSLLRIMRVRLMYSMVGQAYTVVQVP